MITTTDPVCGMKVDGESRHSIEYARERFCFCAHAAPLVGSMISPAVLTLQVIPVSYALVKQRELGEHEIHQRVYDSFHTSHKARSAKMKPYQKGEAVLVMMVVMLLAIVLFRDGHMGMMGHRSGHAEIPAEAAQQTKTVTSTTVAPNESTEQQR